MRVGVVGRGSGKYVTSLLRGFILEEEPEMKKMYGLICVDALDVRAMAMEKVRELDDLGLHAHVDIRKGTIDTNKVQYLFINANSLNNGCWDGLVLDACELSPRLNKCHSLVSYFNARGFREIFTAKTKRGESEGGNL